jgi:hypothetical protein
MITVNGRNVNLYNSMFDYVNDADFSHYEISDGKERETTFIEAVKPIEDSNFSVWGDDEITYEGNTYVKVNFGEDDDPEEFGESFLLESALDEEVFLIFTEKRKGIPEYTPATGQVFRTRELAKLSGYYGRVRNYKCKDCARHFTGEIVEEDE